MLLEKIKLWLNLLPAIHKAPEIPPETEEQERELRLQERMRPFKRKTRARALQARDSKFQA